MIDLFGHRAKAALAASEAKVAGLEEALALERKRNEDFHRQLIAMVDAKALRVVQALDEPKRVPLPTDLKRPAPTKLFQIGKRASKFGGVVRAAILARKEEAS